MKEGRKDTKTGRKERVRTDRTEGMEDREGRKDTKDRQEGRGRQ